MYLLGGIEIHLLHFPVMAVEFIYFSFVYLRMLLFLLIYII